MIFTEIKNEDTGITMYRCTDCEVLVCLDEQVNHLCFTTPKEAKEYFAKQESKWFDVQLKSIEKAFDMRILKVTIQECIRLAIKKTQLNRDKQYEKYNEAMKNGVPLLERRKLLDQKKIDWCNEHEKFLNGLLSNLQPREYQDWMKQHDYVQMKRLGFRKFMEIFWFKAI